MDVRTAIEHAWSETTRDFEDARKAGNAWLWTEHTLRLYFFRNLCKQPIKIHRALAETLFHVGRDYRPDLVVDVATNDGVETVVFEFKYFKDSGEWEKDWEKLRKYGVIGWRYGYFLSIDRSWRSEKVPKETRKVEIPGITWRPYEIRAMVHLTSPLKYMPSFRVAESLLKKSLRGIPYVVSESFAYGIALLRGYYICFDMTAKPDKCVVWARLLDKKLWRRGRKLGRDRWFTRDSEGCIQATPGFAGDVLIGEFETNTYGSNVRKVKDSVGKFREQMNLVSKHT